ncbi:MAG: TonB-dependent receptor [Bacteroidetes bacterium]|nr:TonB-dependent receptor [Bacteroidota bacterium]
MKIKYIYTLLSLIVVFYVVPAYAQNKKSKKKEPAKASQKAPAKKTTAQKTTAPAASTAQDTTKKGQNDNNLTEEIIVTTNYKPVLADAVKIRINPDLSDKTPFKAPLTYVTLDKRLERNTDIKQLEAMKMPPEVDSVLSNNYARLGLGNFKTTYGEVYVNNGKDEGLQLGAFAKHLAQSSSNLNKQNEIRDEVGVFARGVTDENSFTGRLNYSRLGTNFYGFDQANPPGAFTPLAQHFNTFSGEGEITKNYKDEPNAFTYAVKLNGYIWNDAFQAKENNIVLTGFLNETVNQFYAGLGASLDLSTQQDSAYSISNNILRLNPYLKFQGDNYKIDAGLNLAREFGFSSRAFIFPSVKAEFQVIPKYVRIFAEASGDVNKSSLRDFSVINPYMGQDITIINSVDKLDLSVGLKGMLAPGLGFKATVFRNSVKDLPMFVSNFNASRTNNTFQVIYDNGNSRVTGFNGELDFKASDDFDLFGRVEFRNYVLATEAQPWNLPKFKLTAGTVIHITSQLSVNATLLYRGSTFDRTVTTNGATTTTTFIPISGFADLNGGVEYKLNSRFSIFGQVNNILNTTNQVWLYYPNYGFNIFGGVGVHF